MKKIIIVLACAVLLFASCESREERMMREMKEGLEMMFGEDSEFDAEMEKALEELGNALEDIDMEALEGDLEKLGSDLENMFGE